MDDTLNNADAQQTQLGESRRAEAEKESQRRAQVTPQPSRRPTMSQITRTKLPDLSRVKANGSGEITSGLKKALLVKLVDEVNQLHKAVEDDKAERQKLTDSVSTLTKDQTTKGNIIANLNERLQEKEQAINDGEQVSSDRNKELEEQNKKLEEENKTLKEANSTLQLALASALQSLKDAGKHCKDEQSKTINGLINTRIKDEEYRYYKFVRGEDLDTLTKRIYDKLGDELKDGEGNKIVPSEFLRIYKSHVQDCLGARRQYTQTGLQKAFLSKSL